MAHVIGVADLALVKRLGVRQPAVRAARAGEILRGGGVTGDQEAEWRFGSLGFGDDGELILIIDAVSLDGDVDAGEVFLAIRFLPGLVTLVAAAEIKREQNE